MAEQEQNRTEQATPFKLAEARKRGSVAKSVEMGALATPACALLLGLVWGQDLIDEQLCLASAVLSQAHLLHFDSGTVIRWLLQLMSAAARVLTPLFIMVAVLAVLVSMLQTGPVFTFFPLKPDVQRLNPIAGFKRLFSKRMVFELCKSLVKLLMLGMLGWFLAAGLAAQLLDLLGVPPAQYGRGTLDLLLSVAFKILVVLAFMALADLIHTRWQYRSQMRMSRRELKEEVRNREGDPRIRARMRELRNELVARARAVRRVPEADVLLINPVHLAVALQYRRDQMHAPQVIAKGSGDLVEHMKAMARRHRVPVVQNRALARRLFAQTDVGQTIPEALYGPVAKLLLWIYARRDQAVGAALVKLFCALSVILLCGSDEGMSLLVKRSMSEVTV